MKNRKNKPLVLPAGMTGKGLRKWIKENKKPYLVRKFKSMCTVKSETAAFHGKLKKANAEKARVKALLTFMQERDH